MGESPTTMKTTTVQVKGSGSRTQGEQQLWLDLYLLVKAGEWHPEQQRNAIPMTKLQSFWTNEIPDKYSDQWW
jgi:hypothetical protein